MNNLPCPLCNYEANDDEDLFGHLYYGHKKSETIRVLIKCLKEKKLKGGV